MEESATAGNWFVCPHYVGRRSPPTAVCETWSDRGLAPSLGPRTPSGAAHVRCRMCIALDSATHREAVVAGYKNRRDPLFAREDIFVGRPPIVDLRRAPSVEPRTSFSHDCLGRRVGAMRRSVVGRNVVDVVLCPDASARYPCGASGHRIRGSHLSQSRSSHGLQIFVELLCAVFGSRILQGVTKKSPALEVSQKKKPHFLNHVHMSETILASAGWHVNRRG